MNGILLYWIMPIQAHMEIQPGHQISQLETNMIPGLMNVETSKAV